MKSTKPKKVLKKYKSNAKQRLNDLIKILDENKDFMVDDIKRDIEHIIGKCKLAGKMADVPGKNPPSKEERYAKIKDLEKEMAIHDSPFYKYDEKHVNRLMRLLKCDKERAQAISSEEKSKSKLHVPYVENALDKTMEVEMEIEDACINAINTMRNSPDDEFVMKDAFSAIDDQMKTVKKSNKDIISKWKISTKSIEGTDYIYVDVDYKTTLKTHRHILQLTPAKFVNDSAFFDDISIDSLPKGKPAYREFKYGGVQH